LLSIALALISKVVTVNTPLIGFNAAKAGQNHLIRL
jgi:hypothetical protein